MYVLEAYALISLGVQVSSQTLFNKNARVAQLVERCTCNANVAGSIPVSGFILFKKGLILMDQIKFIYAATFLFIFLAIIWAKNNFSNLLLKIIFIFISIWGIFISLHNLGFIIKI